MENRQKTHKIDKQVDVPSCPPKTTNLVATLFSPKIVSSEKVFFGGQQQKTVCFSLASCTSCELECRLRGCEVSKKAQSVTESLRHYLQVVKLV